jgi:phosphatidylserine decarboxylase
MSIVKEGFPFIFIPLAVGIILLAFPLTPLSLAPLPAAVFLYLSAVPVVFALFCAFFFRDPKIEITRGDDLVLSPCNGTVLEIEEKKDEKIIRVFLSIFNVHLQRSPLAGKVKSVEHRKGKFLAAWNREAHSLNEQNIITLETAAGMVVVRQIAGFLARRCVSWVKPKDELKTGDKIGLIKFSSQVDLHLPITVVVTIKPGDKVRAGITIVGATNGRRT